MVYWHCMDPMFISCSTKSESSMSSKQYYPLLLLKHCVDLYYVPSFQIFTFEFHIRFSILVRIAIKLTRRLGHITHPFKNGTKQHIYHLFHLLILRQDTNTPEHWQTIDQYQLDRQKHQRTPVTKARISHGISRMETAVTVDFQSTRSQVFWSCWTLWAYPPRRRCGTSSRLWRGRVRHDAFPQAQRKPPWAALRSTSLRVPHRLCRLTGLTAGARTAHSLCLKSAFPVMFTPPDLGSWGRCGH